MTKHLHKRTLAIALALMLSIQMLPLTAMGQSPIAVDKTNAATIISYDTNGNYIDTSKDALGNITDYSFNTNYGLLDSVTDANAKTTGYTYDSTNRLTNVSKNVTGLYSGTATLF